MGMEQTVKRQGALYVLSQSFDFLIKIKIEVIFQTEEMEKRKLVN